MEDDLVQLQTELEMKEEVITRLTAALESAKAAVPATNATTNNSPTEKQRAIADLRLELGSKFFSFQIFSLVST
jgi:hypothetical protein